jgi:hypothetical protein
MTVTSGAPTNDNEVQGPVTSSTVVYLPQNSIDLSEDSSIEKQRGYVVGANELIVRLNGIPQVLGTDYTETSTTSITTLYQYEIADILIFEIHKYVN